MSRHSLLVFAVAAALPFAGCEVNVNPVGDVHVVYRIGSGTSTCQDVGIQTVLIRMMTSKTRAEAEQTYPCTPDDQSAILTEVPADDYTIRVEGRNTSVQPIYTGESADVEVKADRTNGPFTVVLSQLKPSLRIWFGFAEVGGCDRFGIETIQVVLWENGSSEAYNEPFECQELTTSSEGLLVENLSDTSTYDLRVRGVNDNAEYKFEYNADEIAVEPGAPTEIEAQLTACSGTCSAP